MAGRDSATREQRPGTTGDQSPTKRTLYDDNRTTSAKISATDNESGTANVEPRTTEFDAKPAHLDKLTAHRDEWSADNFKPPTSLEKKSHHVDETIAYHARTLFRDEEVAQQFDAPSTTNTFPRAMTPDSDLDAGFTNREVRLIFERAGQLDGASDRGERRMSLAEIQEIGAQAGLDPADIAAAAATVRSPTLTERVGVGAARFRVGTRIPRRLGEDGISDVVQAARDATGYQGTVSWAPGSAEWRVRSALGAMIVAIRADAGGTRIDVLVSREDARFLSSLVSGFAGVGFGAWVASLTVHALGMQIPAALLSGAVMATLSGWAVARAAWRPLSRRWADRTRELLATVTRAVDTSGHGHSSE